MTRTAAFVLCALVVQSAAAQEALWFAPLPSSLTVTVGGDDAGAGSFFLDSDLGLPAGLRLQMSVGTTGSLEEDGEEASRSALVGVGTDPREALAFATHFEYRAQPDAISFESVRPQITWAPGAWLVTVEPEFRRIELITSDLVQQRRDLTSVDLYSRGGTLRLGYFGFTNLGLSAGYYRTDYTRDVGVLDQYPLLAGLLFTQTALDQSRGLDESRIELSATYYFERASLGLAGTRAVSAVDGSVFDTASVTAGWTLGPDWDLLADFGTALAEDTDAHYFSSVSIRRSF